AHCRGTWSGRAGYSARCTASDAPVSASSTQNSLQPKMGVLSVVRFIVGTSFQQAQVVEPFHQLLQNRQVQVVDDALPLPLVGDQPGVPQDGKMVADRTLRHVEMRCDLAGGKVPAGPKLQDPAPRRVRQRLERLAHGIPPPLFAHPAVRETGGADM